MSTPVRRKYRRADVAEAQQRYAETGDAMFLALAVGARPHEPPLWVIEECAKLVESVSGNADGGNEQERMGRRLDEMWRFFIATPDNRVLDQQGRTISNPGPPLAAAARHALAVVDQLDENSRPGQFEAGMINLQRMWRAERKDRAAWADVTPHLADFELFDGLPSTPRMERMLKEWGDGYAGHPYRHVSLHLARLQRREE